MDDISANNELSLFRLPLFNKQVSIRLIIFWLMSLLACTGLGLASIIYQWSGLPLNFGGVDVYLTVYPPLILCMLWVIWAGFWWGFIPAYIATLTLALYSGVPLGWSAVFAFADPLGLAIFAMVYSVIPISTDLRSLNSVLLFILISFVSSILGSSGAFIWVYSNQLAVTDMYIIWQGWWFGAFVQNLIFVAPVLFLFDAKVNAWKRNASIVETVPSRHVIVIASALVLGLVLVYLYLAIEMSRQQLSIIPPGEENRVADLISGSSKTIFWVMCTLIMFIAFFADQLFKHWTATLQQSALSLEYTNAQLRSEVQQRELLNSELEQRVEERTDELLALNVDLSKSKLNADKANQAKSDFLANMCHEIRTPMNGVLGMAELLKYSSLTNEQQEFVSTIQRSGHTLMVVINDILDYSKIEANQLGLLISSFNLKHLIDDIATPYRLEHNNRVLMQVKIDPNIPASIRGDSVRLHQVLNNLLSNAFKFTAKGQVDLLINLIVCTESTARINFMVSDTGKGISPQLMKRLFDPFTQEDESSSRRYGGTGLGLSICQRLVALMGGKITIESEVGNGATFQFTIDVGFNSDSSNEEKLIDSTYDLSSLNVLLVEDNTVNQMVVKKLMSKLGVTIAVVSDGFMAVELACRHDSCFDLILMDCEMPGMDGYEATRKIRQWEHENNRSALVISALTAHALPEQIDKCIRAGMNKHMPKPTSLTDLRGILEYVIVKSGRE